MNTLEDRLRGIAADSTDALGTLMRLLDEDPATVERVCLALGAADAPLRRGAELCLDRLKPERLAPYTRRLVRLASITGETLQKAFFARLLPLLELDRSERSRLVILLEDWSTETGDDHWHASLDALVVISAADAVLARRLKQFLERLAAHGDPRLAKRATEILVAVGVA